MTIINYGRCISTLILLLAMSAVSSAARAEVSYHEIWANGDGGRRDVAISGMGVKTGTIGTGSSFLIYTDNNMVVPSCGVPVPTVADAISLADTIKKYSAIRGKKLNVYCTQFRQDLEPSGSNFINLDFPL